MKMTLEVKQKCSWFWLRGIRKARIDKCCVDCFLSDTFHEVYEATHYKEKAFVEVDITPSERVKAYYLCGISRGHVYNNNTHVAFVPCEGEEINIENDKIKLRITGARQIHFENYVPHPEGEFTREQRRCRNWIFANYLLDDMPL